MNSPTDIGARPSTDFRITERDARSDGTPMLALAGSIDAEAADVLSAELQRRIQSGQVLLHLDFDEVSFVGSSGVGALIASIAEVRDEGGDLVLCRLSDELRHVFELLDLLSYVTVAE